MSEATHAVTGAFGYTGKYIARRLLEAGESVVTLTNSAARSDPFSGRVRPYPLCFDRPNELTRSLRGVRVLYNTYWVRFNHRTFSHAGAVENTKTLFRCARAAGVERVVHVSITNPTLDSPLEYFRGKAELERDLHQSGLSHAILRPAVLFGRGDILINNIAWFLRHLPMFGVPGDGSYRLQPIHVDDLVELAVDEGRNRDNRIVQATGPETFTFRDLVEELRQIVGVRCAIVSLPPKLVLWATRVVGALFGDVVLTAAEIDGLMADLLAVDQPAAGTTRLSEWAHEHRAELGTTYASELGRRRNRSTACIEAPESTPRLSG